MEPDPPANVDEDCVEWGDESPVRGLSLTEVNLDAPNDVESRKSFWAALCTVAFSIPALVGSWCWPVVLAAIIPAMKGMNNSSTKSFTHSLTWGINLAVLTNMLQFIHAKTKKTRKNMSHFRKWGPCYLILLSIFLVLADLTRHLVNDSWGMQNCKDVTPDNVTFPHLDKDLEYEVCESHDVASEYNDNGGLSVYGWVFTIFCTWSGFACMVTGIFWGIGLPKKVMASWERLRPRSPRQVPLLVEPDDQA